MKRSKRNAMVSKPLGLLLQLAGVVVFFVALGSADTDVGPIVVLKFAVALGLLYVGSRTKNRERYVEVRTIDR
jgi:hypothetical protein